MALPAINLVVEQRDYRPLMTLTDDSASAENVVHLTLQESQRGHIRLISTEPHSGQRFIIELPA